MRKVFFGSHIRYLLFLSATYCKQQSPRRFCFVSDKQVIGFQYLLLPRSITYSSTLYPRHTFQRRSVFLVSVLTLVVHQDLIKSLDGFLSVCFCFASGSFYIYLIVFLGFFFCELFDLHYGSETLVKLFWCPRRQRVPAFFFLFKKQIYLNKVMLKLVCQINIFFN